MSLPGVFEAHKKDGTLYYRASLTYRNKHISLGSFENEDKAHLAYTEAQKIISTSLGIDEYSESIFALDFAKYVSLINFRDRNMYIKTPIYLCDKYFLYYLSETEVFKFDVDDLFFYSNHSIQKRNGYLFVSEYGMQTNILSRYGIKNHAVEGRDFVFKNGDNTDYTYSNIHVINKYYGVSEYTEKGRIKYKSIIHVNGYFNIGTYASEEEAAIAYNKAANLLKEKGIKKDFPENYLENLSAIEYAKIYNSVKISKRIRHFGET